MLPLNTGAFFRLAWCHVTLSTVETGGNVGNNEGVCR